MDTILKPDDTFNFDEITLAQPTSMTGGIYFTKINFNGNNLYIETPASFTKQGFVKAGKKIYCELVFNNNNEEFIHWIERLEIRCQDLIYQKGDDWFENRLDRTDIESAFTSPIRIFKSGKNYLLRVNTKNNQQTMNPAVKIYNENEDVLTIEDVKDDTNIISILEIQGIKFTSRNFQIEIEVKQILVLNNDKMFDKCLINHRKKDTKEKDNTELIQENNNTEMIQENNNTEMIQENNNTEMIQENNNKELNKGIVEEPLEDLESVEVDPNELMEIHDLDLENTESITLKKPNQVYHEIYKIARKKAKEAKKQAIVAFLEAKNIKKTYLLDDLDSSDTDSDMEGYLEK